MVGLIIGFVLFALTFPLRMILASLRVALKAKDVALKATKGAVKVGEVGLAVADGDVAKLGQLGGQGITATKDMANKAVSGIKNAPKKAVKTAKKTVKTAQAAAKAAKMAVETMIRFVQFLISVFETGGTTLAIAGVIALVLSVFLILVMVIVSFYALFMWNTDASLIINEAGAVVSSDATSDEDALSDEVDMSEHKLLGSQTYLQYYMCNGNTDGYGPLVSGDYAYVKGNAFTTLNACFTWYLDHVATYQACLQCNWSGSERQATPQALAYTQSCGISKTVACPLSLDELATLSSNSGGRLKNTGYNSQGCHCMLTYGNADGIEAHGTNDCHGFVQFYATALSGNQNLGYNEEVTGSWGEGWYKVADCTCAEDIQKNAEYGDILWGSGHSCVYIGFFTENGNIGVFDWGGVRHNIGPQEVWGAGSWSHYTQIWRYKGTADVPVVSNEDAEKQLSKEFGLDTDSDSGEEEETTK